MLDLQTPLPWLLGSVVLAVIATNLSWLGARRLAGWSLAPALPALGWLATSLFYLLPPVGAWRKGALSLYWLGTAEIDWVASLAAGAPLAALMGGVLVYGWLVYRRTLAREDGTPTRRDSRWAGLRPCPDTLRALVDTALLQWHWAFYRALTVGVLASGAAPAVFAAEPMYWGTWLAAGLTAAEWALNPFGRARLRREGRREAVLRQTALAVGTSALFLVTRNFYIGLALHLTVEILISGWFPLPAPVETQPDRA